MASTRHADRPSDSLVGRITSSRPVSKAAGIEARRRGISPVVDVSLNNVANCAAGVSVGGGGETGGAGSGAAATGGAAGSGAGTTGDGPAGVAGGGAVAGAGVAGTASGSEGGTAALTVDGRSSDSRNWRTASASGPKREGS